MSCSGAQICPKSCKKWLVSGCWETPGSLVCRSCGRPGHGLEHRWHNKEVACWHVAWHRSSPCPLAHGQTLPQHRVGQGMAQGPCLAGCLDEDTLFLAEERWTAQLGIPWRCSSSGPKNWPWSALFTCADTVIPSKEFFAWTRHWT